MKLPLIRLTFEFEPETGNKRMLASEFKKSVLPLSSKLLRFAIHLTQDEEEARDAIQDIFLKLWQKKESLDRVENIEAFAMQMTRNRCLDLLRSKNSTFNGNQRLKQEKEEHQNLQREIELSETASLIKKLISRLPDIQQTVMFLRDVEQYEFEEIARITEMNVNAIRVVLSRARKKVRDELLKQQQYGTGNHQIQTAEIL
jgi:RNA polymerase sigma-70 factor (ECF subfamily)